MRIRTLSIAVGLVVVVIVGLWTGGAWLKTLGILDPANPPGSTSSYTLADLYNRLDAGTAGTQSTFTEPTSGPGSTMHDLNEIMGKAPAADNTNGATAAEVANGNTFWGLNVTAGEWGLQTGTLASQTLSANSTTVNAGIYSATTLDAVDVDLVAGNIKSGVTIFGVPGERYGGCTCSGTLNGTRWCDNGDGTVTDLTTCLVWLKKADWGGTKSWRHSSTYDDAHTRAGILRDGVTGANLSDSSVEGDWRLPTKTELCWLANGTEAVRSENMRAFTGVLSSTYWSSTTCTDHHTNDDAWTVYLKSGSETEMHKSYDFYVWPVRGGQ